MGALAAANLPTQSEGLAGTLALPQSARGLVLFAHGSGSSRFSPRNRCYVAQVLQQAGLATLLLDLLTPSEEAIDVQTRQLRFDIPLLATRLRQVTDWLKQQESLSQIPLGYFGASTGAAAALMAAAERPTAIGAIVSRGGRPDLHLEMNQTALQHLRCVKRLAIVPGATHLFEESGSLERVAALASDWFCTYLSGTASSSHGEV